MLDIDIDMEEQKVEIHYGNLRNEKIREIIELRDKIFVELKQKGLILDCLGFKINNSGSNNPLLAPTNCITPVYKMLYKLSNFYFRLADSSDAEFLKDVLFDVSIIKESGMIEINDIISKLREEGIIAEYKLKDKEFVNSLNPETKLTMIFRLVESDYNIQRYKFENNLYNYYLALTSKVLTYRTEFKDESFVFKFSPYVVNFSEIVTEVIKENNK